MKSINKNSVRAITWNSVFFAIMSVSFLASLLGLFGLGHALVDAYVKGNQFQPTPSSFNFYSSFRIYMALIIVALPAWAISMFSLKNFSLEDQNKDHLNTFNLFFVSVFILIIISMIHLVMFVYTLLGNTVTLQTLLHLLVTLAISGLGIVFIAIQLKK